MGVIRVNKNKDYTVMSNYHLRDTNLSLKAKGLLSQMFSLPDDWNYSLEGLAAINKEGIKAIRTILEELEQAGYLVRTRVNDENGRFAYIYDIFEQPQQPHQEEQTEDPKTEPPYYQKGYAVSAHAVQGHTLKGRQLNTKELSTKELNTKEYKRKEEKKEEIKEIVNLYNDTCVSLPSVKVLTAKRIKSLNSRLNTYSISDFQKVFSMAEASLFLKGKNDRGWRADFDWLINENNMVKVLEGRYLNNEQQAGAAQTDKVTQKFSATASWYERKMQEAAAND